MVGLLENRWKHEQHIIKHLAVKKFLSLLFYNPDLVPVGKPNTRWQKVRCFEQAHI